MYIFITEDATKGILKTTEALLIPTTCQFAHCGLSRVSGNASTIRRQAPDKAALPDILDHFEFDQVKRRNPARRVNDHVEALIECRVPK